MTETMWSFVLAAGSIGGLWVVSKKPTIGWAWILIMEFLWITYAALIRQWGFMVLCICYAVVYTFNLYKTRSKNVEKILGWSESSSTSSNFGNHVNIIVSTDLNYEINDGTKTGGSR